MQCQGCQAREVGISFFPVVVEGLKQLDQTAKSMFYSKDSELKEFFPPVVKAGVIQLLLTFCMSKSWWKITLLLEGVCASHLEITQSLSFMLCAQFATYVYMDREKQQTSNRRVIHLGMTWAPSARYCRVMAWVGNNPPIPFCPCLPLGFFASSECSAQLMTRWTDVYWMRQKICFLLLPQKHSEEHCLPETQKKNIYSHIPTLCPSASGRHGLGPRSVSLALSLGHGCAAGSLGSLIGSLH